VPLPVGDRDPVRPGDHARLRSGRKSRYLGTPASSRRAAAGAIVDMAGSGIPCGRDGHGTRR
jgi:hypothetical protein